MTNRNDLFDEEPDSKPPSTQSPPTTAAPPPEAGRDASPAASGPMNAQFTRRQLLIGGGIAAVGGAVVGISGAAALGVFSDDEGSGGGGSTSASTGSSSSGGGGGQERDGMTLGAPTGRSISEAVIMLKVNGEAQWVKVASHETLAEVLRRTLGLVGTKIGCDRSECSACTVIVNGVPQNSCSLLAIREDGKDIATIEGQVVDGQLSPVQQAFLDKMGLQCGFCTPGQIMQATALLQANPKPTEEDIRRHMSGNLCKCSAYANILTAVQEAATKMPGKA